MGCQCSPPQKNHDQIVNLETENIELKSNDHPIHFNSNEIANYPNSVFTLINKIRCNPCLYAKEIDNSIENIKIEDGRPIYSGKLKVGVHKGSELFRQVAEELRSMSPMSPLTFKEELVINPPSEEDQIKDPQYFHKAIVEKRQSIAIEDYFKEAVRDPIISVLMIIADDTERNSGKKREAVLNPRYKYIGISSTLIGKLFCAYYTFSQ